MSLFEAEALDWSWNAPSWDPYLKDWFGSSVYKAIYEEVEKDVAKGLTVYPRHIFRAFELTPFDRVRVVIVGQDPYHGPGQADGLAFSVPDGMRIPPSLRNIREELVSEGFTVGKSGSLDHWARQGVLLLNTALTVREGEPNCYKDIGWNELVVKAIKAISEYSAHRVVFMLWGRHAGAFASYINHERHFVLMSGHPSPLAARRGPNAFMGCGHFKKANELLSEPIQWGSV